MAVRMDDEGKIESTDMKNLFRVSEYFHIRELFSVSYTASLLSLGAFVASVLGAIFIIVN